jgi:flagellar biosynthesis/type III secretory pathway protein FliH
VPDQGNARGGHRRAHFLDVTPKTPRVEPWWLSKEAAEATISESQAPIAPFARPEVKEPAPRSDPEAAREPFTVRSEVESHLPSLASAPVPEEFVQAMRRSLRESSLPPSNMARELAANEEILERMRSLRPSELPPRPNAHAVEPSPALQRGFREAVEQLANARGELLESTASQLAKLATTIARRVIARELTLAPEIVEGLVREALEALSEDDGVDVRVGRGFVSAVDGLEQKLGAEFGRCRVTIDANLPDYGCIVKTEFGEVDESVEKRLEHLLEALKPDSEVP